MTYVITRTWYCPQCKKEGRPEKENILILYGHTHKKVKLYVIDKTQSSRNYGFTPHIIQLQKVLRGERKVELLIACAMEGCGVWVFMKTEDESHDVGFNKVTRYTMSLDDWIALKGFKRNEFYIH
jgi:hypothetical protein